MCWRANGDFFFFVTTNTLALSECVWLWVAFCRLRARDARRPPHAQLESCANGQKNTRSPLRARQSPCRADSVVFAHSQGPHSRAVAVRWPVTDVPDLVLFFVLLQNVVVVFHSNSLFFFSLFREPVDPNRAAPIRAHIILRFVGYKYIASNTS